MCKYRKETVAILLIAIFVISTLTFVVSAKPKKDYATIQDGTIRSSTNEAITVGYDEFGYNYQAHLFNGLYDDYDRVHGGDYPNVYLIMKRNDAWLSNRDTDNDDDDLLDRHEGHESYIDSGAWCTNHQFGSYWDLEGEWELQFNYQGALYNHEMTITSGMYDIDGTGSYPAGGPTTKTWTVVGSVTDSGDVELIIAYNGEPYEVTAIGKVSEDGTLGGTWTSNTGQSGTWQSTEGFGEEYKWDYFVKIVAVPSDADAHQGIWYDSDNHENEIGPQIWGAFAIIQEVYNDEGTGDHGIQYLSPVSAGLGYYKP